MDKSMIQLYMSCLYNAISDAENGFADLYEVEDLVNVFSKIEEGDKLENVYIIGSNSLIDRAIEYAGLADGGRWL